MGRVCLEGQPDDKEDSLNSRIVDMNLAEGNGSNYSESNSKRLISRVYPVHTMALDVKKSQTSEKRVKDLFRQSSLSLNKRIPKHIISLDEKYLRRCLEMIHISATKSAKCNIYFNLSSLKMSTSSESCISPKLRSMEILDSARFFTECSLTAGSGNAVTAPPGQWIVGSITGNKSMLNIMKNPLFQQLGASDNDINFRRSGLGGIEGAFESSNLSSPGGSNIRSPQKPEKEQLTSINHIYESDSLHDRLNSMSNLTSTSSSLVSSGPATVSHGMLQCTWNGGVPHFVFSVDDTREIYVADLSKGESSDDKGQGWMYMFYMKMANQKEPEVCSNASDPVGKMKVSTSFRPSSNNSRILETEFVLFSDDGNHVGEIQPSSHGLVRKPLSKKVAKIFKPGQSSKHRVSSKTWETSSSLDYCPWEPRHGRQNSSFDAHRKTNMSEIHLLPNFELAAIVIKEQLPMDHQEVEVVGGWGLNFLKKVGIKQTSVLQEAAIPSEHRLKSTEECFTNTHILVPAGYHGGPKTRNGGPSTLVERWRSGGRCDCGGWDIGCPITVLNVRSSKAEALQRTDKQLELKSFDLFIQGTEGRAPTLKMANIRDSLHYIDFQSSLSALQSFAIAVAIIHNQSHMLRPKNV